MADRCEISACRYGRSGRQTKRLIPSLAESPRGSGLIATNLAEQIPIILVLVASLAACQLSSRDAAKS